MSKAQRTISGYPVSFTNIRSRLYGEQRVFSATVYLGGRKLGMLEDDGSGAPSAIHFCYPTVQPQITASIQAQYCGTSTPALTPSQFFNAILAEDDARSEAIRQQQRAQRAAHRRIQSESHWA